MAINCAVTNAQGSTPNPFAIGIAIGLWRKIDKMHQQIDDVKKSHEKHNHVRQLRLSHTQKYWENIVKRGKRIALLQKQRSYEKMQFNKRKSDQIKVQNELNEKLKMNREKFKFLENDQKQLKINKQLTENYLNYKQKLLDHELLIQEKYQHLINLQNRTNQIRTTIDQSHVDICASCADCLVIALSHKLFKQRWVQVLE
ncbi:unnamed protein product [Schistosoma mattheei]|uniref:Uncharacterized protein n=1 Tax=Schistosoma mattheei TaxID=31246 RepID=A0A183NZZ2_9TREM|nr:unnamed protein product [Schistosoma mattheei]